MQKIHSFKQSITKTNLLEILYVGIISFILTGFLALPISIFPLLFLIQLPVFFWIKKNSHFFIYSTVYLAVLCLLGLFISSLYGCIIVGVASLTFLFFTHYFDKEKTTEKYCQAIFTTLLPFLIVFIVEFMQKNAVDAFRYLFLSYNLPDSTRSFHLAFCLTIVFIWTLYFLLTLFIKRKRVAVFFTALPLFLIGFVNMVVLYLTSSPLLPSDIFIFQTAMDVIEEQKIPGGLWLLIIFSLIFICMFFFLSHHVYKDAIMSKTRRMVQGLFSAVCILILYYSIGSIDVLNFNANYRYGFLYYFILEMQSDLPEPEGYIPVKVNTLPSGDTETSKINPNVIIVMSEAFSDLTKTYDLTTSEDPIPYFHSLQESYPTGIVYSSVFGNNTVSSEFECLTGISTGFTTKGSNIYQRYMKDNFYSLGTYYSALGYKTGVFHACAGNNYNRLNAYEMMNYDMRIFLEDLPKNVETIRSFVSDEENFNKVTELIAKTEEPLFLMNITMQNHASYDKDFKINPYIALEDTNGEYKDVERYLSLLKKSDADLEAFLSEIEASSEPTVVLFFGDHQPMVSRDFYSDQIGTDFTKFDLVEKAETYKVPYLLWSNYDLEMDFEAPEVTSMNYLSLLLNDYIGNPDTEWFSLLRELRQYYPVITENFVIDNNGNITTMEKIKSLLAAESKSDAPMGLLKKYQFACYSFIVE